MLLKEFIKSNSKTFIKFCIVGLSNTLIHYFLAYYLIKEGYMFLIANFTGFLVALINSFVLNSIWTFSKNIEIHRLLRFIILSCAGLFITFITDKIIQGLLIDQIKIIITIICIIPLNYILLKSFVYKD